eukprot:TRINITY_DN66857_c0_g1_i1.p1 TRINITY_DN66857_c0_g1~~TRINITY_DN66857_c0_g1_i1.p1  ORF type:complete len:427 (+),score=109.48 TRINITY_DN66857_c0_g1_i1:72-1352(+)
MQPSRRLLRQTDFAIIGGGVAGLACAYRLQQLVAKGFECSYKVYERESTYGGRVAVYTTDTHYWDYGFQRMKQPKQRPMSKLLPSFRHQLLAAPWGRKSGVYDSERGKVIWSEPGHCFAMTPSSRFFLRYLTADVDAQTGQKILLDHRIVEIRRWQREQWIFKLESGRWGRADALLLACPPREILTCFEGSDEFPLPDSPIVDLAAATEYAPSWVVLVGLPDSDCCDFDEMRILGHPVLHSIINNSTKPRRPSEGTAVTVQCTPAYSKANVDTPPTELAAEVLRCLKDDLGHLVSFYRAPFFVAAHLWPNAYPSTPPPEFPGGQPWDPAAKLGVCGDWTLGPRMEDAFTSGVRLANSVAGLEDLDEIDTTGLGMQDHGLQYRQQSSLVEEPSQYDNINKTRKVMKEHAGPYSWTDFLQAKGNRGHV